MNCAANLVKYVLYLFNLIFVVCGILLIIFGSLMLGNMGDFKSFNEVVDVETIPILIIVLGCIVFVVSFFGCCGAIRENACCMTTYAVWMFILFCLQLALVIWMFVQRQSFLSTMNSVVNKAWDSNNGGQNSPMDSLQMAFNCCGKHNYTDYLTIGETVPKSCCGTLTDSCLSEVYMEKPGCSYEFDSFWSSNTDIIRYAGIGVAVVEFVALTLALCLASSMRRSQRHNL